MLYYRLCVQVDDANNESSTRTCARKKANSIEASCDSFNNKLEGRGYFFMSHEASTTIRFGLILTEKIDVQGFFNYFLDCLNIGESTVDINEITFRQMERMLSEAERNYYIQCEDDVLRDYGLIELTGFGMRGPHNPFEESLIKENSKKCIYGVANRLFMSDSLIPELDRIFTGEKMSQFMGHPVNYLIECDDVVTKRNAMNCILQSLYAMGRLTNRRTSEIGASVDSLPSPKKVNPLYKSSFGGAIIVNCVENGIEEEDVAYGDLEGLEIICGLAKKYQRNVLTVFLLPRNHVTIKQKIYDSMGGCSFIELYEEKADSKKAKKYLRGMAAEQKIGADQRLYSQLETGGNYLTSELNLYFDEWYSEKLKSHVFKQYKDIKAVDCNAANSKPKGNAYDELNEMIGLTSAKKVINQAIDWYKAQKLFRDKGMVLDEVSQHMIFTGNPGTAKTTVARLFARIMRDNDIIENGRIVEVGRGDLIGKYVGWTAPTIQRKFKEAAGGILFIDEAYSLVDDRNGSFGDEAINTIVQEMENNRGKVIVIFAGYPDKMEEFLQKNPGLRSRIAHHVNFDDYTIDELCEIARLISKKKGNELSGDAEEKIYEIMSQAVNIPDFGNGRYVRNIIEKAKMAQSSRLLQMDVSEVTAKEVRLLIGDDIEMPKRNYQIERKIGFTA